MWMPFYIELRVVENQTRGLAAQTGILPGLLVIPTQPFQTTLGDSLLFSVFVPCLVSPFFKTLNISC